jgi:hypothetical protein
MSDGFLGRWSRRKLDAKQGKPVEAEPAPELPPSPQPSSVSGTGSETPMIVAESGDVEGPVQVAPPPTLADVEALTKESDYSRFSAADVSPEVKNAAMRKLFADPRYNVMDGLDVYIDDYSRPDPLPRRMLRQLATARFLGLFREEKREQEQAARRPRDVADNPKPQMVAQSSAPQSVPEQPTDADPDLQLQQDHAASGEDPGRGTG